MTPGGGGGIELNAIGGAIIGGTSMCLGYNQSVDGSHNQTAHNRSQNSHYNRCVYIVDGSNKEATRLSGVNVAVYQTLAYIISGLFTGLAALAYSKLLMQ